MGSGEALHLLEHRAEMFGVFAVTFLLPFSASADTEKLEMAAAISTASHLATIESILVWCQNFNVLI